MLGGRPTGCIEQKLNPQEVQALLEKIVVPAELHDDLRKSPRDIFDRVSCPADVSAAACSAYGPNDFVGETPVAAPALVEACPSLPLAQQTFLSHMHGFDVQT